jgi:hypothetical protein
MKGLMFLDWSCSSRSFDREMKAAATNGTPHHVTVRTSWRGKAMVVATSEQPIVFCSESTPWFFRRLYDTDTSHLRDLPELASVCRSDARKLAPEPKTLCRN